MNHSAPNHVLLMHSKITFSIAKNVIMIGLLSKREDDVISSSRLIFTEINYSLNYETLNGM